ncbi:MAG: radical SAM/SPASM domain-containing protein [Thermodesulfovibrionia bacterium]|nr:radical SAM/SPASM domain-containing protein [Thermodesulfovibrionia bacterium]
MISKLLGVRLFDIEVSSKCNLGCKFCPRDRIPETGFMQPTTFLRFLDFVKLTHTDTVSFIGIGEPLLNPHTIQYLRQIKERYPRARTWITTNGQLLTPKIAKELLDADLGTLDISFNGIQKNKYESVMVGAHFEKTIERIEYIANEIEKTHSRMRLQINFIIATQKSEETENIKSFWRSHGVRFFRIQKLHNRGGLIGNAVGNRKKTIKSCDLFEVFTWISWKGDVHMCCHDILRKNAVGNIFQDTWDDIKRRKLSITKNKAWPEFCEKCNDPQQFELWKTLDKDVRREIILEFKSVLKG